MDPSSALITWLKDARAMELGLIPVLQDHADDARIDPEMHGRAIERMELSRRRAELIRDCITRLEAPGPGADRAEAPDHPGRARFSIPVAGDQIIMSAITRYAAEHFEIACYRALLAAAGAARDHATAWLCEDILSEQEEQARWLQEHLFELINRCLTPHAPKA